LHRRRASRARAGVCLVILLAVPCRSRFLTIIPVLPARPSPSRAPAWPPASRFPSPGFAPAPRSCCAWASARWR
jgi:hypothetical protein